MSNEYFNPASVPAPNAPGSSAVMRAEIARIAAAFDLMPVMAGSQNEFVVVDPTGTRLVASGFSFGDLVSIAGPQTVTNKTFAWDDNTWVGFGTGATKNAGTGADEVLLLAEANKLPVLDAWNLTNINPAAVANAVVAFGINLKADANNAVLTGAPVAPTPATADNSARIATTAFVQEAVVAAGGATPSNANPVMNGVAAPGVANQVSRQDHVHPTDTSRAPASAGTAAGTSFAPDAGIVATNVQAAIVELVGDVDAKLAPKAPIDSPTFTGAPKAPTPLTASNDTSIATTAFAQALVAQQPAGMQPSNTAPLMNGVASAGVGVEGSRNDHVHPTDTSRAPASAATAAGTTFTPTGTLSATDVQGAIVELLGETATAAQGAKADTALQPAAIGTTVQARLVSGTNIKTINGESVLGSGNISTAAGFRNKIINGDFRINQRVYVSGAATTAGQYTLDRWKVTGTGGVTFSTTANKTTVTIPSGQTFQQVIEGLNLQTGTYVLSWEGTAQGRIAGGSYGASGAVTASITGGTNTTIEFNSGTVALVQLEIGTTATPFEHRPYGTELVLCQRYFEKSYRMSIAPGASGATLADQSVFAVVPASITDSYTYGRVDFKVTKRAAPTVTTYSTDGTPSCANRDNGVRFSSGSANGSNISEYGVHIANDSGGTLSTTFGTIYTAWTASIEL